MTRRPAPSPNRLVVWLMRKLVLPAIQRRYQLQVQGVQAIFGLKPPFLVVANHVNFWDPFWVSTFVPVPVQWIASDNLFRTRLYGTAMRLLGSIAKVKLMTDAEAVRQVFGVIEARGVVGIFPEGVRSYDGRGSPPMEPVARLIRKLRVPVVSVRIEGGYLARPRWSHGVRLGPVRLDYRLLFRGPELASLAPADVYAALAAALSVDEMRAQAIARVPFKGPRPAEYLERLLFLCPHCRVVGSMVSRDRLFACLACGHAVRMNDLGFLEPVDGPLRFENPAEWNAWQLEELRSMIRNGGLLERVPLVEQHVTLFTGTRARPFRRTGGGTLILLPSGLGLRDARGVRFFPVAEIKGMNIQNREKLEFSHAGSLFRLDFRRLRASPYLWMKAVEFLQEAGSVPGSGEHAGVIGRR